MLMIRSHAHNFHIPVLGIGYSIDTPVKVAQFGISSVISLVDDMLIEKMREFYSLKFEIPYNAITEKIEDFRAKRITAYLDLIDKIVKDKFEEVKNSVIQKGSEFAKYMEMLPDSSELKEKFTRLVRNSNFHDIREWLINNLTQGSIDVNIMTKLDRPNYLKKEQLPVEFNDAHAALRGFANSNLNSSVVLSAGMNARLYSYMEQFDDFYPDKNNIINKKIILKVSDYRSAIIQGKFLAKKGLWVSEYRVESGLNCGGHAFATNGFLLGPILDEFKLNRNIITQTTHELLVEALKEKHRPFPENPLPVKVTAQGGIGTAEEHEFLIDYYQVDSVGWGTPFLLVPEVTNVEKETLKLLSDAQEEDIYLSDISPLGIPFSNLKGNSQDMIKDEFVRQGKPGSACTKKYASLNYEYSETPICTASRQYQKKKIDELKKETINPGDFDKEFEAIVEKSCICKGLGTAALLVNNIDIKEEGYGISICPGPNMAYFSETVSLTEMVDHIYGRKNIIKRNDRPNMFIKELMLYIDYLEKRVAGAPKPTSPKQSDYFIQFKTNLSDGISYYKELYKTQKARLVNARTSFLKELSSLKDKLDNIQTS
jgi:hypothetical protein